MTIQNQTAAPRGAKSRIAHELGISPTRVSQLSAKGMPTDSTESARQWMLTNQPEGVGHRKGNSGPAKHRQHQAPPQASGEASKAPATPEPETPEAYLARICATEMAIHTRLLHAVKHDLGLVPALQRDHAAACRARNEVEAALIELGKKRGTLINKADALQALTEAFGAVLLQTDSIPKLYNQKFPGLDPVVVEPILQEISKDIRVKTEAWIRQNKLNQKP